MEAKTVIISHYSTGGAFLYLKELVHALAATDYPVLIYLPRGEDMRLQGNISFEFILQDPSKHPSSLKNKLCKYPFHLIKYLYNAFVIKPPKNIKLAHILFPFYLTDLITIRKLKKRGIKVILTVHEVLPHKPYLGRGLDRKLIKKMYDASDKLLAHTLSLKKEIIELFAQRSEKIDIVPHGFFHLSATADDKATLQIKYHVPRDKKILLFFGSIRENKGLDILLDIMDDLKNEYFLLITGQRSGLSEKPAEFYQERIRKHGIRDSVYWVERYITDEEASEVFKVSDAVILPYKRNFHAQSGVLNLAIGYEKPCVVSDVGGVGEVVREYGLGVVVEPESASALKKGILALSAIQENDGFKKYKAEKSWDTICERLVAIYERLAHLPQ